MKEFHRKLLLLSPLIAVTVLITILHWIGVFDLLELKTYDFRMREVRGPLTGWLAKDSTRTTDVVLVQVDDESWRLVPESWPYSRGTVWGSVVENLSLAGAKVIVFDIQFDTPEAKSEYRREIRESLKNEMPQLQSPIHGDSLFAQKIKEAQGRGTAVVIPSKIVREPSLTPPEYLSLPIPVLTNVASDHGVVNDFLDPDGFLRRYPLGGVMEHEPEKIYLSLGLKAVKAFCDISDTIVPRYDKLAARWHYGPVTIQGIANSRTFPITYYGASSNYRLGTNRKWGTFPSYSVAQVLDTRDYMLSDSIEDIDWMDQFISTGLPDWVMAIEDSADRQTVIEQMGLSLGANSPFAGKIVMIGVSVETIHDMKATPFYFYFGKNQYMPGVETHANAIQSILDQRQIKSLGGRVTDIGGNGFPFSHFAIIAVAVIFVFAIEFLFSPVIGFFITVLVWLIYIFIVYGLFVGSPFDGFKFVFSILPFGSFSPPIPSNRALWIPVVFPTAAFMLAYLAATIQRLLVENHKKNLLKESFGTYVSPELIDQMYRTDHRPELGGEEGHRTAFFTDIVSFSSFSELLSPTQLVTVMNEYLSAMTDIILRNGGTLDKYIGDAIVAFWGAPIHVDNQEYLACKSAVEMEQQLALLRTKWRNEQWPELVCNIHHRIGINSGPAVTGNMGSTMRMNYTMMGDTVNTAARLESSAKQYGIFVQISDSVYEKVRDHFSCMYLDTIRVKGKSVPVKTYELVTTDESEIEKQYRALFCDGVALYQARKWSESLARFQQAKSLMGDEGRHPAQVYIDRCAALMATPPADDWDGVWTLVNK